VTGGAGGRSSEAGSGGRGGGFSGGGGGVRGGVTGGAGGRGSEAGAGGGEAGGAARGGHRGGGPGRGGAEGGSGRGGHKGPQQTLPVQQKQQQHSRPAEPPGIEVKMGAKLVDRQLVFMPFFPSDNPGVESEDVTQTAEILKMADEGLEMLLAAPLHKFWSQLAHDSSLQVMLDSFLRYRRRAFDLALVSCVLHVWVHICMFLCMFICMYVACIHACMCVYICVHLCTCVLCMYVCI